MQRKKSLGAGRRIGVTTSTSAATSASARAIAVVASAFIGRPVFALGIAASTTTTPAAIAVAAAAFAGAGPAFQFSWPCLPHCQKPDGSSSNGQCDLKSQADRDARHEVVFLLNLRQERPKQPVLMGPTQGHHEGDNEISHYAVRVANLTSMPSWKACPLRKGAFVCRCKACRWPRWARNKWAPTCWSQREVYPSWDQNPP